VDPEAYVAQVINLVLCGFATHISISRVLAQAPEEHDPSERLLREMLRVAKSSLFETGPAPAPARARPAIAGGA